MNFIDAAGRVLRSPAFKFVLILVLIIVLIVPLLMVSGLIGERESRAQGVRREVGQLWGPEQQILGPFLVVPYTVRLETVQGDSASNKSSSTGRYSRPRRSRSRARPIRRRCIALFSRCLSMLHV